MTARPKTFHLEYDRHGRQWIAWQGTTGHIIGPVGRNAATAKAMEMVLEYRRDYIPYLRKRLRRPSRDPGSKGMGGMASVCRAN